MDYIMETVGLRKSYKGNVVVNDVNIHVPKGAIYGFVGPNGAGKSTVMNSMLKRIAANVKIIFRAVPNFFNSSLIRCAILFSLLCELKEIIFQSVLFTP